MTDKVYDLLVVGGGVNGCGIARDAALRGAKVVLVERGDLAQGTSSASTKLIHGGLRYLEHYEFALVREALSERERLWAVAPHIIWPLRFVLPYRPGLRPRWLLRMGLFLYDHLGGRKHLPPTRTLNLRKDAAGRPLQPQFRFAFEYSDCWVDDARLVVLNARDAADHGAEIHTRSELIQLARLDDLWRATLSDGRILLARAAINAAGPRVLEALGRAHVATSQSMRLVRGSHIVVRRLYDHDRAYFFQLPDKRIFFAIPYEDDFTLVGTTDADHHGSLDDVHATPEEIAYLCEGANGYFRTKLTPADVVWSYAGVRPLIDDGSGKPEAATRGYTLRVDGGAREAPLLSVFGGKITTYRHLAAAAVDKLRPWLPVLATASTTDNRPLPGGDFPIDGVPALQQRLQARYPFIDPATIARLARQYGTRAFAWLGEARTAQDLEQGFGHGLTQAEVDYLTTQEWARTADDILWRRTKLGLRLSAAERAALEAYLKDKGGDDDTAGSDRRHDQTGLVD